MHYVTALYSQPDDPDEFDRHYAEIHTPLIMAIPGVQELSTFRCSPLVDGPSPFYFVGRIAFETEESLQAGMTSPEGVAAAADGPSFTGAGVTLLITHDDRTLRNA